MAADHARVVWLGSHSSQTKMATCHRTLAQDLKQSWPRCLVLRCVSGVWNIDASTAKPFESKSRLPLLTMPTYELTNVRSQMSVQLRMIFVMNCNQHWLEPLVDCKKLLHPAAPRASCVPKGHFLNPDFLAKGLFGAKKSWAKVYFWRKPLKLGVRGLNHRLFWDDFSYHGSKFGLKFLKIT